MNNASHKKTDIIVLSVNSAIIAIAFIVATTADLLGYNDGGFPISFPFSFYAALLLAPHSVIYGIFLYFISGKIIKPTLILIGAYAALGIIQILISFISENAEAFSGIFTMLIGISSAIISAIIPLIMSGLKKATT